MLKFLTLGRKDYTERVLRMTEDRSYDHTLAQQSFGYFPEQFEIGLTREIAEYKAMKDAIK